MAVKSNIALSYIAMLTVVGFFLWVIRNFIRGLRQKDELPPIPPLPADLDTTDKLTVEWPVHLFLSRSDDIPIPGQLVSISATEAFMESSACLQTGQEVTVYVDVPGEDPLRVTARVTWARRGREGKNAAQLVFPGMSAEERSALFELAKSAVSS